MPGTYIALRVHPASEALIRRFLEEHEIPVSYPGVEQRRHCTLIYSPDDFVDKFIPYPLESYFAVPTKFDYFPTKEGNSCLVLKLDCPKLVDRHDSIVRAFGCRETYPEFKPHISFTYDVGDRKLETIPGFYAPIILSEEYCEPLNEDWAKK